MKKKRDENRNEIELKNGFGKSGRKVCGVGEIEDRFGSGGTQRNHNFINEVFEKMEIGFGREWEWMRKGVEME
jgi:hypothetical protein